MAGGLIGKGNGRGRYRPMADINVTPLVDVMLVLLIVFMVTAPMLTSGVNVDLPKADSKPLNADSTPLTVSIKADGNIYLQEEAIALPDLVAKLNAISNGDRDRRIFVRGDQAIPYGKIMELMGTISLGGFTKVALLAQQPGGPAPTKPGG